jgi:hypothetical protein
MCRGEFLIRWKKDFLLLLYNQTSWDAFAYIKERSEIGAEILAWIRVWEYRYINRLHWVQREPNTSIWNERTRTKEQVKIVD